MSETISVTISDNVGPRGVAGPAGSDAEVTNANVNAAIEDDALASLQSLGADTISNLRLDPRVTAYKNRCELTGISPLVRIDEFLKGLDALSLDLEDAWLLGSGMNKAGTSAISLIGLTASTNTPTATYTQNTHGRTVTAEGDLHIFPVTVADDFTMVSFFSGDDTLQAYRVFVRIQNAAKTSALRLQTTSVSGFAVGELVVSPNAGVYSNFTSSYKNENPSMQALQYENGVGVRNSYNGAAWSAQTAYAYNLSPVVTEVMVGGHKGTHQGALLFNGLLSDSEIAALYKLARRTIFTSGFRLIGEGDSIMSTTYEWLDKALMSGNWAGCASLTNIATGGETAKQVYDQAVAGSMATYAPTATFPRSWLVLQCGHNDLASYASTGDYTTTNILFHITEVCRIAKAAGFEKTIVCTLTKGSGISGNGRLDDVDTINAALKNGTAAGSVYIDHVLDVETAISTAAGGGTYWTNTTYFVDGVHPTVAGRQVFADLLNSTIEPPRTSEK